MSIMLVTGFVPLEDHPRPPEEYQKLGDKLFEITDHLENPLYFCQHELEVCWLYRYLEWTKLQVTHSVADNPKKNTIAYHMVQHQKLVWMCNAGLARPDIDVFAWVDMGIHSVPGITNEIILETLEKAKNEKTIVIPGCWSRAQAKLVPDSQVNWRYCGGFMVCPRPYLPDFEMAFRVEAIRHIRETHNISWEVNTLQRLEERSSLLLPIWWYEADHNASMFTNYPRVAHAS